MFKGKEIIGFHQQRAERVYKCALAACVTAVVLVTNYATYAWSVDWVYSQPDPKAEHCYAALDTFENMRLGLKEKPAMKLPVRSGK